MHFNFSVSAIMALAATAFAQTADFNPIYKPDANQVIPAGSTFDIVWDAPAKYEAGSVSIHLIGGATQNTQVPLLDIAAGIKNSAEKYSWKVDASLGDKAIYGLVIKLESDPNIFQYSNPFHIKAGSSPSGSGHVTVTTSTGIKTITLSEYPTIETPTTTEAPVTQNVTTTTVAYNSTTTYCPPQNSTTMVTQKPSVPAVPTSSWTVPTTVLTNANDAKMSVPRARLLDLMKAQCQVFASTYNPEGARMGNKILRQRLKGPALAAYYPRKLATIKDVKREFGPILTTWDNAEEDRIEYIEELKARGKNAPKKKTTAPAPTPGKKR